MAIAKVIVVSGNPERCIRPAENYHHHPQMITTVQDLLLLWKTIDALEQKEDGGMEFDTVIVCNGPEAYEWWKEKDGTPTKNGKYVILTRPNVGGSYGGYSYAYRNTDYDGFLFTEEDLLILGENYMKRIVDRFHEDDDTGFVGLIGSSQEKRVSTHCHGGVGFSTREILKKTEDSEGDLAHPKDGAWDQRRAILEGEIPFTHNIYDLGLNLAGLKEHQEKWCKENLVMPFELFKRTVDFKQLHD